MPKTLPDIIYDKSDIKTPIIDSDNSFYKIMMYKNSDYFSNYESYVNFIKGIEKIVRSNIRYTKYISYLKNEVKLNHCQVLKNVTDDDADIEMHHGPIFTLFDICSIVLEYFLLKKWKISTLRVADLVLDEHLHNRIQVVMVSTTIHQLIHAGEIFVNYHQAFGDIVSFLRKYEKAISEEYKEQIDRYIEKSLKYDSNDFSVLEINKNLWKG